MAMTGDTVGRLASLNVGLPQDVVWRGRTVHTGVWKSPVEGPRMVRRLNIDGDGQGDLGGHGGEQRAVFVYQLASYRYWEDELGRHDLVPGQFGENFTVEGLADDVVCIGDRYRIGDAVFEVTQPRVTCFRVGIRMDDPRIPALLVSHKRPGFYFRVLGEGEVQAGDEIVMVGSGPESLTVAEVDALLYLPGHSRTQVQRALQVPALSPGWKSSFQALLDQPEGGSAGNAGLAAPCPAPAWPGIRRLVVRRIDRESASVVSVHLADPGGTRVPAALPGQYLTVRLQTEPAVRPLLRNYSLSGPPGADDYRISVKREPYGAASGYVHTGLRVGDELEVAAPRGSFTLGSGDAPVLLISAGVGATPVLAMLHALAADRSAREIWWLHGARSGADLSFGAETRSLLETLPAAHRYVCFSRPAPGDVEGADYETAGRLSASVLAGLDLPQRAEAYICGPSSFMQDVSAALTDLGLDASGIHRELFGAAPSLTPGIAATAPRPAHVPAGLPGTGPLVAFARSDLTVSWSTEYASLLELAEACDVPVRWSCRTGVCHTCETAVVSGSVGYTPDPVDEPGAGSALICCGQPLGDLVLDL
jgi:ferredoxin-NADP reductase/MOSC domain-containing protein YiiM